MPLRHTFAVLLFLFASSTASAADGWIKVRSEHFTIIGNAEEAQLRSIARGLEEFLPALTEQLPQSRSRATEPITILIFKDEDSYKPFRPEFEGNATSAAGYFLAGNDWSFIIASAGAETRRIVYHELFHALTHDESTTIPTWANEGLADFYSTFDSGIGNIIPTDIGILRARTWIPLRSLLAASRLSPLFNDPARKDIFYAQSWALVHYLLAGRPGNGIEQLAKYFKLRDEGASLDTGVRDAFQTDITTLQTNLEKYASLFLGKIEVPVVPPKESGREVTVSSLSEAETAAYLGDLLLHLNRLDAAERQLKHALELDPSGAGANTPMGALRLRQNRNADARTLLARAVEVDPDNPLAHFYYATSLQTPDATGNRESNLKESRVHLRKAIELAPWFTEAYRWLGYVSIALQDGYDEAEAALNKAIELAPGTTELRDTLTDVRNAAAAQLQSEQLRRQRDSRKQMAEALGLLRMKNPVPIVEPVLWTYPDIPPPKPKIIYPTFEGVLTMIECRAGLTLVLRSGDKLVKFYTATPIKLEFTSKVSNAANEAGCGYVRPEHRVVVTYRRTSNAAFMGEPVRIEYKD